MKIKQINRQLFTAVNNGEKVSYTQGEQGTLITPNGFVLYILKDNLINTDKMVLTETLKESIEPNEGDKKLSPTGMFREVSRYKKFALAQEFQAEGLKLYINKDLLRFFDSYELYAYSQVRRILVKEFGRTVGVVTPTRIGGVE